MEKQEITHIVSHRLRLIRLEQELSQDEMATYLGISKKTLLQIEKGRTEIPWSVLVTCVALFEQSETLQNGLGNEPLEVVKLIAFNNIEQPSIKTMGGKLWWKDLQKQDEFVMQQNMVSQHYRIIDESHYRWFSSFDLQETTLHLNLLARKLKSTASVDTKENPEN